jgi:hypothetical protein
MLETIRESFYGTCNERRSELDGVAFLVVSRWGILPMFQSSGKCDDKRWCDLTFCPSFRNNICWLSKFRSFRKSPSSLLNERPMLRESSNQCGRISGDRYHLRYHIK